MTARFPSSSSCMLACAAGSQRVPCRGCRGCRGCKACGLLDQVCIPLSPCLIFPNPRTLIRPYTCRSHKAMPGPPLLQPCPAHPFDRWSCLINMQTFSLHLIGTGRHFPARALAVEEPCRSCADCALNDAEVIPAISDCAKSNSIVGCPSRVGDSTPCGCDSLHSPAAGCPYTYHNTAHDDQSHQSAPALTYKTTALTQLTTCRLSLNCRIPERFWR
eukprot:361917-Chlamydomonas_euryale.AAC.16